jgi:hypothetical protein
MIKSLLIFFALILSFSQEHTNEGKISLEPRWNVIRAGSTRNEISKLLGKGVFRDTIGDCGSVYYTDISHSVTVSLYYFTECESWQFEVRSGFHPPPHLSDLEKSAITSSLIDAKEGFGYSKKLHFGDSMKKVRKELGNPANTFIDDKLTFWTYDCIQDSTEAISFGFQKNRLKVVRFFSDGD